MLSSKKNINPKQNFLLIGFVSLFFSLLIIFIKYEINSNSLKDFRLDYTGNILNIFLGLSIFVASLILNFTKKNFIKTQKIFLIILTIISLLLLAGIFFIDKFLLLQPSKTIFNIPSKKFFTGLLFSIAFFIQLYIFNYLWGLFFEKDKLYELRVFVRTFFLIAILIIFTLFYVWNVQTYSLEKLTKKQYEYGFIPGAAVWNKNKPSPIFEARIRKAFELYSKKIIIKFILTGGNAPGEISESEAAQKYLISRDVNKNKIILEKETSTTSEQIKFLKNNFKNKDILAISDGFHLSRITQIAKFYNIKVEGVSSNFDLSFEKAIYYRTRESIALLMFWLFGI